MAWIDEWFDFGAQVAAAVGPGFMISGRTINNREAGALCFYHNVLARREEEEADLDAAVERWTEEFLDWDGQL